MIEQALPYARPPLEDPASLEPALSDPSGSSPLVDAALWIQHALLGTTATAIAVIAIAGIGFLALSGRIELRRGATTIIGCFILFGAPSIAAAFIQMFDGGQSETTAPVVGATPAVAPAPPPTAYDPYAGASVPVR